MKPLIRSASVAAAALVASLGLAAAAAPAAFAATAYCTGRNDLAIMAHADDDFYFAADQIKLNIADGHCFRVVHLTGGDAEYKSDDYYWTRVRAALAGYERMLGLQSPQWTDTWDVVNGKEVLRYQTALTRNATGPLQTLEVQVVGLPCGWYNQGGSKMGKSLGELVNDAELRAITIDGKGTSYNLAEVRAFLEKIFTDEQPSTIFTLDPYGHFFYNGHEGQHPDHIVTARLAQESAYVASHPTVVKYFKTYNLNDLPANLDSAGIIAKNEAMLGYVSVDPGPFTLGEGAKDCSGLSISDQLGDKGWLCKDYAAQDGTYFQAAQLKLADGRCLAVRKSDGEVTFATCTDSAYATDFSLDGQGQVFVGNATRRRLGTTLSAGSEVTAPLYDDTPSDITVTQWRYNPTSKTLQQTDQKTDPSNAQLICVAPNGTGVAMVDCGSGAALTVTRGAAAPTGVPLTIKNKVHGRCVLLSASGEAGAVSMGDCASSDARLKLNAAGQLASAANPNQCLQRREFQQKSLYDGAPCNSASFGQRFALTRVASGTDYTFVSRTPATCMEDLDGLSGEGCHNYEHQLWQLALVDSDGDGDVDQTITFDPLADRTYGEAPFLLTASASSGLPVGFHVVSGPALIAGDVVTITGAGLVTVEATQPGDTQYAAAAPVQQSFMVHPVGLAVTADNATKVYGQPNPAFSASYSGFVAGDGPASLGGTLNFTTAATADSPVGSYPVTPGGLTSDNYTIAFVSGSLLVTRAPLAVKANDASRPLGQPNPAFTVTVSGFVAGDTLASLAGSLSFVTPADLFSPPGTYSITPSGISSPNYAIAFLDGVLTVGAGPDGRIHGDGHILTGGAHHHFKLRVSEGRKKDEGRLEYWVKPERHANAPGDHGAEDGSSDAEFGRSHAGASAGFEATAITFVAFSDDPATRPGKAPRPDVDAVLFAGMGRWNGRDDGYSFEARAIDRGEPGRGRDEFALTVRDSAGALVASVSGLLDGGNIEAMKVGK